MRVKGTGTVFKKGEKWVSRIRWQDELGPHEKSFTGETKTEANKRLKEFQKLLMVGQAVAGRELTLGEWITEALETIYKPKVRPSTYHHYSSLNRIHLGRIGKVKLSSLTVEMIESILQDQSKGGRTREHLRRFLIGVLNHAVRRGKVHRNVAQLTMPVRFPVKVVTPVTLEEAKLIVDNVYSEIPAAAIQTMVMLGLRVGEVLGIRWSDIQDGVVSIERQVQRCRVSKKLVAAPLKTEKSRRVLPLSPVLQEKLSSLAIRGPVRLLDREWSSHGAQEHPTCDRRSV